MREKSLNIKENTFGVALSFPRVLKKCVYVKYFST